MHINFSLPIFFYYLIVHFHFLWILLKVLLISKYIYRLNLKCNYLPKGKIACANVLSDLYAMGVTDCDNMLMLLGVSNKMSEKERDVVVPMMMRGFKVCPTIVGNAILRA